MRNSALVDVDQHVVSPLVYSDPDVYRTEREAIFLHTWLYVGHEQQLSNGPGSFITTYMGEDGVIVCRDGQNKLRVFLNSCPHRGMALCTADHGKIRKFQCPFHAWTFNLNGELVGVPWFKEGYHGELRLEDWGMIEVPRVEVYRGLIFASFDPDIESLDAYLGDAKWYLDILLNRTAGGLQLMPGVYKWAFNSNWKTISENLAGDNTHAQSTHASILGLGPAKVDFNPIEPGTRSFMTRTNRGHGFIIIASNDEALIPPDLLRYRQISKQLASERLSPAQADCVDGFRIGTIFPNFSFVEAFGYTLIRVSHPRGPAKTETWSWTLSDAEMPEAARAQARTAAMMQLAPAGIVETDDSEMWIRSQEATSGPYRSRFPNSFQMGMGKGHTDPERPGQIHRPPTDLGAFGFYERWKHLMGKGEEQ